MRRDVFVYISGPMTSKNGYSIEENIAAGVKVYLECMSLGIPAFCPHLSGAFPSAWGNIPWTEWLEYDFAVIDRCSHVLMMPRWGESKGAVEEHAYAMRNSKPIAYSLDELKGML